MQFLLSQSSLELSGPKYYMPCIGYLQVVEKGPERGTESLPRPPRRGVPDVVAGRERSEPVDGCCRRCAVGSEGISEAMPLLANFNASEVNSKLSGTVSLICKSSRALNGT
jgi:hypothetical protein